MAQRKNRPDRARDPFAVYRRIRKPMPPPEKVIRDRRQELEAEQARRQMEER